jgi:hypothetical protein
MRVKGFFCTAPLGNAGGGAAIAQNPGAPIALIKPGVSQAFGPCQEQNPSFLIFFVGRRFCAQKSKKVLAMGDGAMVEGFP